MTYFSLRKHAPGPEPDETEAAEQEPEETDDQPGRDYGPLLTGILGPGAWIAARVGTATAWGVHIVAVWAVGYYGGWVAAGIVLVWLLAIAAFVPREYLDRLAAAIEQRDEYTSAAPDEAVEEPAAAAPVDPLPGILWQLIGEAPGVHLPSIVRHLHQTGLDRACDRAAVRAALGRRGIPIRPSVREADGRVNQGVHRVDLEAWEEDPSPAAAEAGPKTRSSAATTALTSDVAGAATGVATPPTPAP